MSYDLRVAVKVEGGNNLYAIIDEPKYDSPAYRLKGMFQASTGWNFVQGEWYKASDVIQLIKNGINELNFHSEKYEQFCIEENPNGMSNAFEALCTLTALLKCIERNNNNTKNDIPLDLLYIAW